MGKAMPVLCHVFMAQGQLYVLANDTGSMWSASSILKWSIQKWGHELEISEVNIM